MTDLYRKRGDAIRLAVGPILQPNKAVQPLAGLTIRFTAKERVDDLDADAVLVASTSDGKVTLIAAGVTGEALIVIPGSETEAFDDDTVLHWDVQVADPAGTITATIDSGLLYIDRDVTRTSP